MSSTLDNSAKSFDEFKQKNFPAFKALEDKHEAEGQAAMAKGGETWTKYLHQSNVDAYWPMQNAYECANISDEMLYLKSKSYDLGTAKFYTDTLKKDIKEKGLDKSPYKEEFDKLIANDKVIEKRIADFASKNPDAAKKIDQDVAFRERLEKDYAELSLSGKDPKTPSPIPTPMPIPEGPLPVQSNWRLEDTMPKSQPSDKPKLDEKFKFSTQIPKEVTDKLAGKLAESGKSSPDKPLVTRTDELMNKAPTVADSRKF